MHHYLVSSLKDLVDTQVSQEALDWVVLEIAIATVHLQAVIDNVEALVGREFLGHSAIHCIVWVMCHNQLSTVSYHQSRCLQVNSHLGKLELYILVRCDWSPELLPSLNVISGNIDAFGSSSNRTTRNIETTSIQA